MKMQDYEILAQARAFGLGDSLFKHLPIGARFVFSREDMARPHCILVKHANGYRHEIGGRLWKTGARTACYKV